eukprot:131789-Alexandrium_andersonii.AAC.1
MHSAARTRQPGHEGAHDPPERMPPVQCPAPHAQTHTHTHTHARAHAHRHARHGTARRGVARHGTARRARTSGSRTRMQHANAERLASTILSLILACGAKFMISASPAR